MSIGIEIPKNNRVPIINLKIQKLVLKFIQVLNVWRSIYHSKQKIGCRFESYFSKGFKNSGLPEQPISKHLRREASKIVMKIKGHHYGHFIPSEQQKAREVDHNI